MEIDQSAESINKTILRAVTSANPLSREFSLMQADLVSINRTTAEVYDGLDDHDHMPGESTVVVARIIQEPLSRLMDEAMKAGFTPHIESGYIPANRSCEEWEQMIKEKVTNSSLSKAEALLDVSRYTQQPGTSDPHLGTAVRLTDSIAYDGTSQPTCLTGGLYDWLQKNAHRYGFVMPYPYSNSQDKIGDHRCDPEMIRFIGTPLAIQMFENSYSDPGNLIYLNEMFSKRGIIK